jgi:hypothetical protein
MYKIEEFTGICFSESRMQCCIPFVAAHRSFSCLTLSLLQSGQCVASSLAFVASVPSRYIMHLDSTLRFTSAHFSYPGTVLFRMYGVLV